MGLSRNPRVLTAIFSALDNVGLGAGAALVEVPWFDTKVSSDSNKVGSSGSVVVFLIGGGGTFGVSRGETKSFPTSDSMVEVEKLMFGVC
jgi:hypothetical protein